VDGYGVQIASVVEFQEDVGFLSIHMDQIIHLWIHQNLGPGGAQRRTIHIQIIRRMDKSMYGVLLVTVMFLQTYLACIAQVAGGIGILIAIMAKAVIKWEFGTQIVIMVKVASFGMTAMDSPLNNFQISPLIGFCSYQT